MDLSSKTEAMEDNGAIVSKPVGEVTVLVPDNGPNRKKRLRPWRRVVLGNKWTNPDSKRMRAADAAHAAAAEGEQDRQELLINATY